MSQTMKAMFYQGMQKRIDYVNAGSALAVGAVVDLGQRIGIVTSPEGIPASGAVGARGAVAVEGIFRLLKAITGTASTFIADSEVWWDTVALTAYNAPGSNRIFAGMSVEAATVAEDGVKTDINKLPVQMIENGVILGTTTTTTTS